jgi:hypothetical protein
MEFFKASELTEPWRPHGTMKTDSALERGAAVGAMRQAGQGRAHLVTGPSAVPALQSQSLQQLLRSLLPLTTAIAMVCLSSATCSFALCSLLLALGDERKGWLREERRLRLGWEWTGRDVWRQQREVDSDGPNGGETLSKSTHSLSSSSSWEQGVALASSQIADKERIPAQPGSKTEPAEAQAQLLHLRSPLCSLVRERRGEERRGEREGGNSWQGKGRLRTPHHGAH